MPIVCQILIIQMMLTNINYIVIGKEHVKEETREENQVENG